MKWDDKLRIHDIDNDKLAEIDGKWQWKQNLMDHKAAFPHKPYRENNLKGICENQQVFLPRFGEFDKLAA